MLGLQIIAPILFRATDVRCLGGFGSAEEQQEDLSLVSPEIEPVAWAKRKAGLPDPATY
jgi:hypothetical protein